jgi:MFS family permease
VSTLRLTYRKWPVLGGLLRMDHVPGGQVVHRQAEKVGDELREGAEFVAEKVGGPARVRVVILLASVLALSSADVGTIGAVAPQLERAFHVGNFEIGLLVTVAALTSAVGMLPVGWFTDRVRRVPMVIVAVGVWGLAEAVSAASTTFIMLLIIRLALGALTAVTGPTLASLTGDLFPARERSRIYGFILTGELLGAGFGLLIAGLVAAAINWQAAFIVLSLPSIVLCIALWKLLPEPARGGQSRIEAGAEEIRSAEEVEEEGQRTPVGPGSDDGGPLREDSIAFEQVKEQKIKPRKDVVLDRSPMSLSWWQATRYVLRVRSNVTLIVASALGYFFLSGIETFALIYVRGHYGVSQSVGTILVVFIGAAAILGAVIGGRTTDTMLNKGRIDSRLMVASVAFFVTAAAFFPAIIVPTLWIAMPLLLVGGFAMAAPNPGLDAARLDVMPSRMWGRAEAVRSLLRAVLQAFAPLLFGITSEEFGGHTAGFGVSAHASTAKVSAHASAGLEPTFLIMLTPLLIAGVVVWVGRRWYAGDVAAAAVTETRFPANPVDATTDEEDPPERRAGVGSATGWRERVGGAVKDDRPRAAG